MARKNEKPTADGTAPAAGAPEECTGSGADPGDSSSAGGEGTTPLDLPGALALLDSLRQENEQLRTQVDHLLDDVDAIARSRDAAFQERDTALEASKTKARRRPEEKLLPLLERLSRESQRSGDRGTHAALERVIVAFAEVRHAVREGVKSSKGDGLDFLEDLQESL